MLARSAGPARLVVPADVLADGSVLFAVTAFVGAVAGHVPQRVNSASTWPQSRHCWSGASFWPIRAPAGQCPQLVDDVDAVGDDPGVGRDGVGDAVTRTRKV